MAVPLSRYDSGRDNNFKLIRFIAAALVLYSHAYPLTKTPGEPLERLAGFSLGHFGVDVFFVISGFLVTGSLLGRRGLGAFLRARLLRIFPALAVNATGTALVIGALHTTLPLAAYFTNLETWRYALQNATTWPWGVWWTLPGVFEHVTVARVVNGSLWSLPWELTMYALLTLVGVAVLRAKPLFPRGWLPGLFAFVAAAALVGFTLNEALALTDDFTIRQGLRLMALFATGAVFHQFRERIPMSAPLFAGAVLVFAASLVFGHWLTAGYVLALPYVVLWLAYVPGGPLRAFNALGDYSYGLYLWAFPVEQSVVQRLPHIGQLGLTGVAGVVTLLLAVASWHWVEEPALRRK